MRIRGTPQLVLFLAEATSSDVVAALDEVAEQFLLTSLDRVEWYFPDNEHWRVEARIDSGVFDSYTDHEKGLVQAEVGTKPSAILILALNPRVLDEACDAATTLVLHLLGMFYGIVDDRISDNPIWDLQRIRSGEKNGEFLDGYRRGPTSPS